jgi:predicted GTPase
MEATIVTDSTNPLIERLLRVLEAVQVDDIGLANELSEIRSRLSAPLRVALVGRVSSGKSTLLNALLGQVVAPTDAGECTEVATSFEYGFPERVEIRLVNGTIKEIQLDAQGRLPERLPFPKTEVQDVRVWLANETLHTLTLVDTPGFSSGQTEVDGKGDDALDRRTREAAANCDAVVFVLNQTLRADDMDVLRSFQEAQFAPSSAVNAVGALTKADKLASGCADPLDKAEALAKRYSERHSRHLAEVVPVVGLWSETAESGALDEQDVAGLIRLAEMDGEALGRILSSVDRFRANECPVDAETRGKLLDRLDLHGIRLSIALVGDGARSAGTLRRELSRVSGIERLRSSVVQKFAGRTVPLRLLWALEALRDISYRKEMPTTHGQALRDVVEKVRLDEAMHEMREMAAFQRWCDGDIELTMELEEDLRRLALNRDPVLRLGAEDSSQDALRSAAQAGVSRWRTARLHTAASNDEVARTVIRSYGLALTSGQRS